MAEKRKRWLFSQGDGSAEIVAEWWRALESDRGERAYLRRAGGATDVVFSPAYHRLLNELRSTETGVDRDALAAVAGLAAHVKEDAGPGTPVAVQMAEKGAGGTARVSGLRFRRLMAVKDRDELYHLMVRVIRLLGGRVNLRGLAASVYWWNDNTRKQWACDYYAKAPRD